ncbi:MAG: hypothetical protein RIE59_14210 [Imperialibacter sp.]
MAFLRNRKKIKSRTSRSQGALAKLGHTSKLTPLKVRPPSLGKMGGAGPSPKIYLLTPEGKTFIDNKGLLEAGLLGNVTA